MIDIYFSDFFRVSEADIEKYGAFNVSLINDLPLFVDPFLLFNSHNQVYQELHQQIIKYLKFLRDKAIAGSINDGLIKAWFMFSEVEQNWLGYSRVGNKGTGLGIRFARSLAANLHTIFANFGQEHITKGSHLEKLCLIDSGVGRDNISDFTTNLIKEFLLDYTQSFAKQNIDPSLRRIFRVKRVRFNYSTESWEHDDYDLPAYYNDYVLLTPRDLLTKDEMWISRSGLFHEYDDIADSVSDDQLRAQVNNYFLNLLPPDPKQKEINEAIARVLHEFPQIIEYYIRYKEDHGDLATDISKEKVSETQQLFIEQVKQFVSTLISRTHFYDYSGDTLEEARDRVLFLKHVIENNDGYRLFYLNGRPIKRELDLQLLFRLTWFATPSDVNRETNNGRGPVDYKISRGNRDKSLVEFKLASNTGLKRNLERQVEIYEKANETEKSLKVILYFSEQELRTTITILQELKLESNPNIILIDARSDNKPSASKA